MKKRGLVISLLVLLAVITSGFTYAFWAAGIGADSETKTGTISIGAGDTVTSTVNVAAAVNSQDSDELVPVGFEGAGKISSLTLTFSVDWDSTNADASGLSSTLTVSLTGATNGTPANDAAVLALINAAFNGTGAGSNEYTIISDGSAVSVIVTITIDEPANLAEYQLIATKDLTLTFTFSAAATTTPAA
jgi:hypothetical protein